MIRRAIHGIWGLLLFCAVLALGSVLTVGACTREVALRTALDVASCAVKGVADAAAPVLGQVAAITIGGQEEEAAISSLKTLGVQHGIAAILCALDRLIMDLGPPPPRTAFPSAAGRAAARARALRQAMAESPG